jgi:hypothetical protein
MPDAALAFLAVVCAALTAGAMFGLWLAMRGQGLPASAYVAQQQEFIRGMNVAMPRLGATTLALTLAGAFLADGDRTRLTLLLASAACFLVAGLITRFANQPINAVVITWSSAAPPADWQRLRDQWWRWHVRRTLFGVAGLCVLVAASLLGPGAG